MARIKALKLRIGAALQLRTLFAAVKRRAWSSRLTNSSTCGGKSPSIRSDGRGEVAKAVVRKAPLQRKENRSKGRGAWRQLYSAQLLPVEVPIYRAR